MATVTAFIRTRKSDKEQPVNVRFRLRDGRTGIDKETGKLYAGFQLFYTSNITVIPDKWDSKLQKIKARCVFDEKKRIIFDSAINDWKKLIKDIYSNIGKSLTSDLLDSEIDKKLNPQKYEVEPEIKTLFQFINKFIQDAPNRKDKTTGRPLSKNSLKQYPVTAKYLKEFAKSLNKKDFEFSDINQNFYNKFVEFLQKHQISYTKQGQDGHRVKKFVEKSSSQNSVGRHIKVLKTMLNEASRQGYNSEILYNDFHVFMDDVDTIYLNESELQQLKDADLSETPYLDRVRDWFLLLAWTGSRFSDLGKIAKADIKDGFITFRQQKTGTKVVIPVHPVVTGIFEKYKFNLPDVITNQRFNEYIKEACRIAGITSKETMTRTIGGKVVTESFEKWEHVTSHTGRRCFATNMYKRGLPTLAIMSITGHKTEKSFLKYIKVKQNEHAEMMKKAWENMYK